MNPGNLLWERGKRRLRSKEGKPRPHAAFRQSEKRGGVAGGGLLDPRGLPYGTLSFILWTLGTSKMVSLLYINPGAAGIWELSPGV